jgi:hypothetical protein
MGYSEGTPLMKKIKLDTNDKKNKPEAPSSTLFQASLSTTDAALRAIKTIQPTLPPARQGAIPYMPAGIPAPRGYDEEVDMPSPCKEGGASVPNQGLVSIVLMLK